MSAIQEHLSRAPATREYMEGHGGLDGTLCLTELELVRVASLERIAVSLEVLAEAAAVYLDQGR